MWLRGGAWLRRPPALSLSPGRWLMLKAWSCWGGLFLLPGTPRLVLMVATGEAGGSWALLGASLVGSACHWSTSE
eukprot:5441592-Prorocentrum_lima.AAC.1